MNYAANQGTSAFYIIINVGEREYLDLKGNKKEVIWPIVL